MKKNSRLRSRCTIQAARWAAYAAAGAATAVAASNDADGAIYYSGPVNATVNMLHTFRMTTLGTRGHTQGPPPPGGGWIGTFRASGVANKTDDLVAMQSFEACHVLGFKVGSYNYASRLAAGANISVARHFTTNVKGGGRDATLQYFGTAGGANSKWRRFVGTGFMGFEFKNGTGNESYGWARITMNGTGTFVVNDYAFGSTNQAITAGEEAVLGNYWTGGANSTVWATAGNWNGAVPGATGGSTTNTDTATFNAYNAAYPAPAVDAGRNLQNIIFDNTFGALTNTLTIGATSGNALLLTAGGVVQVTSTVANPQVINAPLVLEGNYTFSNNSTTSTATLTFGGGITAASLATLTLSGANTGSNTLGGIVSDGSGGNAQMSLAVKSGNWVVTAPNTYSGGTTISGGVFNVANTTGSGTGAGPVTVTGGSIGGNGSIGGAVTISAGGTLAPGGSSNLKINSTLGLTSGSNLSYILGASGVSNAGPTGGNDLTTVNGALTLNPNETVSVTAGAGFEAGTYVLAHYSTLTDNSSGFSGWAASGADLPPSAYSFVNDTVNDDIELVVKQPLEARSLFVSDQGGGSGQIGFGKVYEFTGPSFTQTTYASGFSTPAGIAFDSAGNLFVANTYTNYGEGRVQKLAPQNPGGGVGTVVVSDVNYGYGLAVDANNNLYESTQGTNFLQLIGPSYARNTINTNTTGNPYGMAFDAQGHLWVGITSGSAGGGALQEYSIGAGPTYTPTLMTTLSGTVTSPVAIAFDSSGNMYVADSYQLTGHGPAGTTIYELAYNSGTQTYGAATAYITGLNVPSGVVINSSGDLFESNSGAGTINEYSITGSSPVFIATIATGLSAPQSVVLGPLPPVLASSWIGVISTNWYDATNWTGNIPGSTTGTTNTDTALFNQTAVNSPTTIDAGGRNLMNITFALTVNALTVGATSGPALLLTSGGTIQTTAVVASPEVVNAPLTLEGNYTFGSNATSTSATLSFGGGISPAATSGTTTLTLNGSNGGANTVSGILADNGSGKLALSVGGNGVWVLNGSTSTYSGGTTIASGATLELAGSVSALGLSQNISNAGALVAASGSQTVGTVLGTGSVAVTSGTLTAYQIRQNSLNIGSGATVALVPSGSGSTSTPALPNNINFSSSVTSLSIAGTLNAWTGTLDIGNNGLVIAYGTLANDPYTTINNMVESGYNGGVWGGTGITSSLAQAGVTQHISTPLNIGLLDFTPGTGNYSNTTFISFEGQTVTTNAILVRLTYMDDLVLAGDMASNDATSDALLFAANYGTGTTWGVGDLVHDGGPINSSDALLFAANYVVGLPSLDGSTGGDVALGSAEAAVPEPASLGLLAIGAVGLLAIRRGRKRKNRPPVNCLATVELSTADLGGEILLPLATRVGREQASE